MEQITVNCTLRSEKLNPVMHAAGFRPTILNYGYAAVLELDYHH